MKRGELYWVDFPVQKIESGELEREGAEQFGKRPAAILYSNRITRMTRTIIVIPITRNMAFDRSPMGLFLPKGEAGLTSDSIALIHQMRAVDKARIGRRIGALSAEFLRELDVIVREVLGLE